MTCGSFFVRRLGRSGPFPTRCEKCGLEINDLGASDFQRKVSYIHGHLPVFQHEEKDLGSFRLFTSQLVASGTMRQVDIARAFGVPLRTVKRYVKLHREQGAKGLFAPRRRRSASVVKGEVQQRAQELLDAGKSVPEVGRELQVLPNTLHKAIRAGRAGLKAAESRPTAARRWG